MGYDYIFTLTPGNDAILVKEIRGFPEYIVIGNTGPFLILVLLMFILGQKSSKQTQTSSGSVFTLRAETIAPGVPKVKQHYVKWIHTFSHLSLLLNS